MGKCGGYREILGRVSVDRDLLPYFGETEMAGGGIDSTLNGQGGDIGRFWKGKMAPLPASAEPNRIHGEEQP